MGVQATAPTWDPTAQADQAAKETFSQLDQSSDAVIIEQQNGPNKFILQSKGYFDLQSYVLTGKNFPKTTEQFEKDMPSSAFKKLTDIDPEIYNKTKDTMVGIGSACEAYNRDHLAELVTAAEAAIQYSDNTIESLETATNMNLKFQLDILLDPKYKTQADLDDTYKAAKKGAQLTLGVLRDQAIEKKNKVDQIKESLITVSCCLLTSC